MGIKHLQVIRDSNLVVCQARGDFALKELSLAPYRATAQRLEDSFEEFNIEHSLRPIPVIQMLKEEFFEQPLGQADWRSPIKEALLSPDERDHLKVLKDYALMVGELYKKLPGGVLARCLSPSESIKRLKEVHEKSCGASGSVNLYRRLQRLGYYWPEMSKQAATIQGQCTSCQYTFDQKDSCAALTASDWRVPLLEYLIEGILPDNHKEAYRLKRLVTRYFVEGGILFWKGFKGEPLRCLGTLEAQSVVQEVHVEANSPAAAQPGELDLIGPINPPSKGHIWILVATEYFTKWVEVVSLKKATGPVVANFIREHIICRFGIPHKIVTDNGTPFVNKNVRKLLDHRHIKDRKSTPYYPQGNGQAKATNRVLLRILSKMVHEYEGGWTKHLLETLWAYRSSSKTATGLSPFSLVYGTEAISLVELLVPTPRVVHRQEIDIDVATCAEIRTTNLEILEETLNFAYNHT
ncbi:uncharacterized protein LOC142635678 [Castanea sativa]|uniref:uncharacterized protein LOC142635678 n=1 Tax=Castanea sativa TaxID=21020 RepID=UPI003F64C6E8